MFAVIVVEMDCEFELAKLEAKGGTRGLADVFEVTGFCDMEAHLVEEARVSFGVNLLA